MDEVRQMESLFRAAALFAGGTASLALAVSKAALPVGAAHLVQIANELGRVADHSGVSKTALLGAADRLSRADVATRPQAASELVFESIAFAQDAGNAGCDALMRSGVDLALAAQCFLRVASFNKMDGGVAGEPNRESEQVPVLPAAQRVGWTRRIAGWWTKRMRRTRPPSDVEALSTALLVRAASPAGKSSCPVPQGTLSEKWLGMQVFSLSVSLCLLPYMGPDGLLKKETFSSNYLWRVNLVFLIWWGLVALGIPCSLYGDTWIELQYARLSSHLGILGISVLVAMFSHWMLAIEATIVLRLFLFFATAGFGGFYIRCCRTEDL